MPDLATLKRDTSAVLCLACGKCSTMCPLAPSEWFSAARMVAIRHPETEIAGQSRSLNACLTCGSCEARCPEGVRFIEFVRGVRQLAPPNLRQACPHGEMLQSAARLMAGPHAPTRDLSWLGDLEVAEEGAIALFVGCLPFFDILFERELGTRTLDIARSAVEILNGLGIRPVVLAEERCCGHDLLWNGEQEAFEALAAANAAAFAARGVEEILTTCAECCRTWSLDCAAAVPDFQPRVRHFSEFLAERLDKGDLVAAAGEGENRFTYQDPCRLGRHLAVTEAPRRVLAAVGNGGESRFVEMERNGSDAVCCGTSGFIHCDASSKRLQSERLASASATGADTLVTACPKCLVHFNCSQTEDRLRGAKAADIAVEDLTVLAARMLRPAEPSPSEAVDIQPEKEHAREV